MLKGLYKFLFKMMAIVLVIIFLAPLAVKFVHEIGHKHETEVCDNHAQTHLHEIENDCDLCHFNLNTKDFNVTGFKLNIKRYLVRSRLHNTSYSFKYNHQNLSYSLRGPPFIG